MAEYKVKVPIVGHIIFTLSDADSEDDVWNFIDDYEFTADDWVNSEEFEWYYDLENAVIKLDNGSDDWHKEGEE